MSPLLVVVLTLAQAPVEAPAASSIAITRASGPIHIDGDLSDAAWQTAVRVDTWYETNPGDNVTPQAQSVGYLTYDDHALYAAFKFLDPDPARIRAPLGDHDNINGDIDYGGVIVSPRHDGRSAILFLSNPRGVQYDAVSDDSSGEDSSPDFFWDSAARITKDGWVLELRVPFSSLRYPRTDPQTWGIMLYRNYPRAYRYQMFSTRMPRGSNCFICHAGTLTGLSGLPGGGHLVLAPYVSASRDSTPLDEIVGSPLQSQGDAQLGGDLKWTPAASTAIDATVNPDFSQIESDVAQVGANERFALFYSEKRPFFLEGIDLFATPVQAVYTRTITSPRFGLRSTGRFGSTSYTVLFADDRGGGSVILPGPNGSDFADQDFHSLVGVARIRHDVGRSFVSVLASDREVRGGGHNRVLGPDFQWRPGKNDVVTGQWLLSRSSTPVRPELADEWNGQDLGDHAGLARYEHSTPHFDAFAQYTDIGDEFRADNGFVPQVGYRETNVELGRTFRPQGFLRRIRTFSYAVRSEDRQGELISREIAAGAGMDGGFNSFIRLWYSVDRVRAGDVVLPRQRLRYVLQANPSRAVSGLSLEGFLGEEVDFDNFRTGTGGHVAFGATLRPTSHLQLRLNDTRRWLDVAAGRVFTAKVDRLRADYTFTRRSFLRTIVQYVETLRDPALYLEPVQRRTAELTLSLLLAYKLNWQTVLFLGYGDDRETPDDADTLHPASRQLFLKLSYAFQR